jgi:hypothetical protein
MRMVGIIWVFAFGNCDCWALKSKIVSYLFNYLFFIFKKKLKYIISINWKINILIRILTSDTGLNFWNYFLRKKKKLWNIRSLKYLRFEIWNLWNIHIAKNMLGSAILLIIWKSTGGIFVYIRFYIICWNIAAPT